MSQQLPTTVNPPGADEVASIYDPALDPAARSRDAYYRRSYDFSSEQYEALLHAQGNRCLICHKPNTKAAPLVVDHNHTTGRVRALLCSNCNTGCGLLQDSPLLLARAAGYLLEHGFYGQLQTTPLVPTAEEFDAAKVADVKGAGI
jgi:hypothetical protein